LRGRSPPVFIAHSRALRAVKTFGKGGFRLNDLLISALASVGLTAATLWAAGRFLGEKLFGHWLDGRLQRQNQAHAVELAQLKGAQNEGLEKLKNEQNREIEKLRGDIAHLQDRGKHSNDREYTALTAIWENYSDLYTLTNACVIAYIRYPDLQGMDDDGIVEFLDKTDFTAGERAAVRSAANANNGLSRVLHARSIAQARSAYFDFRALFDKQNVFIPKSLTHSFHEAADKCIRAITLREADAQGRRPLDVKDNLDFLEKGPETLKKLNDAVRERLHRE
jgi:hypothetical protein